MFNFNRIRELEEENKFLKYRLDRFEFDFQEDLKRAEAIKTAELEECYAHHQHMLEEKYGEKLDKLNDKMHILALEAIKSKAPVATTNISNN